MSSAAKKKKSSKKTKPSPSRAQGKVKRGSKRPPARKAKAQTKSKKGKTDAKPDSSVRLSRWVLLVGVLLLLWPLGRLAIAIAAERIAESISGLDASVGAVAIADGGRRVRVENLQLRHPQRYGDFLRIDEVDVPFAQPLWRDRGGSIEEVTLRGLRLRIYPGDLEGLSSDRSPRPRSPSPRGETPSPAPPQDKRAPEESSSPRGPRSIVVEDGRIELAMIREGRTPFVLALNIASLRALPDGRGGWRLDRVDARFLGGRLGIEGGRKASGDWNLDARLAGAELARHAEARQFGADGTLNAALKLHSTGQGPAGAGWLDLRRGMVWELPVFSDLVAALGLATGSGDLVRRARARFHLEDGGLEVSELHLRGTPLSLWGSGRVALDGGDVDLNLVPRIAEGLTGDLPLIGEPTQFLLDLVGGAAVQVRMRGTLADPELRTDAIPVVGDPLREIFNSLGVR